VRISDQGVASATTNTTQQIGGAVSTALLNTFAASALASYVAHHPADPMAQANAALHSYATAYWWSAGFFAFGAVVTVLLFHGKNAGRPATDAAPPDGRIRAGSP
jgi:amino acid transporter